MMRRGRQCLLGGQRPASTETAELRAGLACWDAIWKADGTGRGELAGFWPEGDLLSDACMARRARRRSSTTSA